MRCSCADAFLKNLADALRKKSKKPESAVQALKQVRQIAKNKLPSDIFFEEISFYVREKQSESSFNSNVVFYSSNMLREVQ